MDVTTMQTTHYMPF